MPVVSTVLFLHDFEIAVEIGIHPHEQGTRQRILVSIEMEVDPAPQPVPDDIAAVLDYDFLRADILRLVADRRFGLQEVLCREIVAIVARRRQVRTARISVRKPDVYADSAAVGVRMDYCRDGGASG